MPIDTSMYNALGVRPKSMMDYEDEYARQDLRQQQMQQNALALQAGQLGLQEKQAGIERANALRGYLSGGNASPAGLRERGLLKEAADWEESTAKQAKDRAAAERDAMATAKERMALIYNAASGARDQTSYSQALSLLQANGVDVSAIPQQFDPKYVADAARQALTEAQRLDQEWKAKGYDLDVAKQAETARNNRDQNAVARGQLGVAQANVGLRRQELEHNKSAPRGQFLETPNGYVLGDPRTGSVAPVLGPDGKQIVGPRTGSVAPVLGPDGKQIVGKSADRALTDSQAKANLFGSRMQESDRILSGLDGKYSPAAVNAKSAAEKLPVIGGVAGMVGNAMLSDSGQQAEQAQRDFINAVLRRESGAVISDAEFANAAKQYFPQPNDSAAVKAQKAKNRKSATDLMLAEVPTGKRGAGAGSEEKPARKVVRTGKDASGKKVVQYDDGSIEHAD